ncbi:MAG: hypothetical protein E5Y31_23220 [Mesorhizobium sp.]|nr:MAG: hypothetical protein E5Y31_23220 [Mesorhizobium sp.]
MRWNMMILASCLLTAGCVGGTSMSERQDANVQSSLQYDSVPCNQLLAQRNGLVQQYNLPTPDMRSKAKRDTDRASGEIDAMNRSIDRRECGQSDKQKKLALPG